MKNKLLTGLMVWTLFIIMMGVLFPIPTTSGATSMEMVMESYTIYGFFSLIPIVFYGTIISFVADWLARRFQRFVQPISFVLHLAGGAGAYIVTQNLDITILAMLAAMMFFLADRCFVLLYRSSSGVYALKNLPIVVGFIGVTAMVLGSSIG
ncbi:hypothetical protein [Alteribacillus iranensis]|uniref:Uncharacterized protein n=1 Tax=Alteribacillus iranensis TaxID=930128 RepID=A0A1I2CV45_9BACI|nr:hypothetical protein [Alteribacillus iranensis]SFE72181.1 hypothetical protein SAMN05192532_103225 [Alteribacillus iranensis]